MTSYKIVRFYQNNDELNGTVITRGLTLEQAQAHCDDPETSSETCQQLENQIRTDQHGPWFEGYYEE